MSFYSPLLTKRFFAGVLVAFSVGLVTPVWSQVEPKPRIIITADPELDDNNSLIRFILYSTDVQIEGLVYASSMFHWKGDGKGTKWYVPGREYERFGMNVCPCESWRWAKDERFIHDIVDAYTKSYPNLKVHHKGYPAPDYLKSKIRYGNIEFDGDFSKDTPGSELIKAAILDDKPGQLYITNWGGASTIARTLKSIQDQYQFTTEWTNIKAKIARKVVLLPSGDQDDTYATYIKPNWPEIEYRQFSNSPNYGYGAQIRANETNKPLLTPVWMTENVTSKGALGSLYRVWGDGKQMVKGDMVDYFGLSGYTSEELKKMGYFVWMPPQEKGSWLGEGDNHTFMNMLGNGLRAYERGSYGGWGGRSKADTGPMFSFSGEGSADQLAEQIGNAGKTSSTDVIPFPDFFAKAQNSFAARMKWAVTSKFSDANHEPSVSIQGPLKIMVNTGQKVKINGIVSDPDGNKVSVKWIQMPAGSYPNKVEINNAESLQAEVMIPKDATAGQTIHVVLEATDTGTPALTNYQRVIIEVRGK
ncbi:hypothetical protein FHS57_001765 [Runella defluvii]|uniref:DUF1593 domain-containing protein n=1 Tax=Runella defluvii TaxID=370973 RepID=A0A7W5ZI88_9BACT|nr:DUF1593 domain-containing protein [Runella defluvii]MBB3837768.1 hypothetical protein [Runella defluvii]